MARLTERRASILRAIARRPLDLISITGQLPGGSTYLVRLALDNLTAAGLTRLQDGLHTLTDAGRAELAAHDHALTQKRQRATRRRAA